MGSAVVVTSALPFPFSYRVPRDSITPRILKNLIVVWLFISALAPAGCCQTEPILTVKVLDARNGKPLKHMRLWLARTNRPQLPNVRTNDGGIAVFHLPDPLPNGRPWLSSPFVEIRSSSKDSSDQVFLQGIDGENSDGTVKFPGNPNPGKLVLFVRRLNVFQRRYDFWY